MSDSEQQTPVLVIGAGPTGLTAAIELARRGIRCRVVDAAAGPRTWARATIVHGRTLEIFESLGIAEDELSRGVRSHGVNFFSRGERVGRMDFATAATRYNFELMLSEEETEGVLRRKLSAEGVEVEWGQCLTDFTRDVHGVRCLFHDRDERTQLISARWLVGSDGHDSMTRRLLGETFSGFDYAHEWAVLDCRLEDWPHPQDEVTVFLERDAMAFLPLPNREWRVYFRPTSPSSDLLDDVRHGAALHVPGCTVRDPKEMARFRTSNRIVRRYRHGRIFLAGDAAHLCSPIEGHGMNTGIQDAHNLAWKIALVESGVCDDILLDSYELERRPVADSIRASGDAAETAQQLEDAGDVARRDAELARIDFDPRESRHRAEAMCELLASYRSSPIVAGDRALRPRAPSPGDRLPDAGYVAGPDGAVVPTHAVCHGTQHTILALVRGGDGEGLDGVHAAAREASDLVGTVVVVAEGGTAGEGVYRADGTAPFDVLGVERATILLVRPDRFVAFRQDDLAPERLANYVRALRSGRTV